MVFNETGRAAPNLYVLGNNHFPMHLITGTCPAFFDAGIACLGVRYLSDFQNIAKNQSPIYLFLTHVHFDHCGAAAFLKAHFPDLIICASPRAAEILQRPNAVATMARLSEKVKSYVDQVMPGLSHDVPFASFHVDQTFGEGDHVEVGDGLMVQVLETPGHTWDSLSYYIPQKKWLFMGEAAGIIGPSGRISTEFAADYDAYMHNIDRFSKMDVKMVCQSHVGLFFEEDATRFFSRSRDAALRFRHRVEYLLTRENGDIQKVVERIKVEEYDDLPEPKQPLTAYLLNLQARVRHLAARL